MSHWLRKHKNSWAEFGRKWIIIVLFEHILTDLSEY